MATPERTPTEVDRIAEDWVDTLVELDPSTATYIGRTDQDHLLPRREPVAMEEDGEALSDREPEVVEDLFDALEAAIRVPRDALEDDREVARIAKRRERGGGDEADLFARILDEGS